MASKRVFLEIRENFAVLTLNDGDKNVLNLDVLNQFNDALDQVVQDGSIDALITSGGSGRFYSNGIDLEWLGGQTVEVANLFMSELSKLVYRILTFPVITVAAVNGHAFAGGAFLMFSHDYVVMNESRGWVSINEVHLPSRIPFALLDMLKCKIPLGLAQTEIIAFGKRLTAERGVQLGVVHKTAPKESLVECGMEMASAALSVGPLDRTSLGWMKRDLYENVNRSKTEFNARLLSKL
ncbi:hypothetical protein CAPTEDRAFT_21005 [Capitella teleta]|uniref:Enoyl-CoA hydratase n=1 Tax=Capitella teleta TaxID=283909 RepID=R7T3M1_CAPTE|nr:hypothetical protein CAPTEDRAFT_21005 [Capitella teleta]|eukprot:ELT87308.1 hypothetical protein CAPTEDRAFT_21005 [Capitella teleta]